ncbi:MAG TPA: M56 family metallopeptidase, partial [Gemmatimonadaceae bacterium]
GAARAAEWLARLAGYRVRWVWVAALALAVSLSVAALLRGTGPAGSPRPAAPAIDLSEAAQVQADAPWRALNMRIANLRRSLNAPLWHVVSAVDSSVSPAANVDVAALSLVVSFGVAFVLVGVGRRFRRARRAWPLVAMQGIDVRIAPRIGPIVIGVMRPDIVVPRWLLARSAEEQRLVVTHENEHVRARDPLLISLAWCTVVVAPWNPAIWYMLSRLRLAVELDCDARVLRRGAAAHSYGSLLIDVAQHASALRLSALGLTDDSSHLHQRILAMKPSVPRFACLRSGLAAALALAGVLIACQARLPTDAEVERMDVATPTRIDIETQQLAPGMEAGGSGRMQRAALMQDGTAGRTNTVSRLVPLPSTRKGSFAGLVFIDGVRVPVSQMMSQLNSLHRNQIESVEVLKGRLAAQYYSDPEAAKGVIVIKTKRGRGAK